MALYVWIVQRGHYVVPLFVDIFALIYGVLPLHILGVAAPT